MHLVIYNVYDDVTMLKFALHEKQKNLNIFKNETQFSFQNFIHCILRGKLWQKNNFLVNVTFKEQIEGKIFILYWIKIR